MYRALFEAFGAECVGKIWRGAELDEREFHAFRAYLDAREASGRRLLGKYSGRMSASIRSGRCGMRPLFR